MALVLAFAFALAFALAFAFALASWKSSPEGDGVVPASEASENFFAGMDFEAMPARVRGCVLGVRYSELADDDWPNLELLGGVVERVGVVVVGYGCDGGAVVAVVALIVVGGVILLVG